MLQQSSQSLLVFWLPVSIYHPRHCVQTLSPFFLCLMSLCLMHRGEWCHPAPGPCTIPGMLQVLLGSPQPLPLHGAILSYALPGKMSSLYVLFTVVSPFIHISSAFLSLGFSTIPGPLLVPLFIFQCCLNFLPSITYLSLLRRVGREGKAGLHVMLCPHSHGPS